MPNLSDLAIRRPAADPAIERVIAEALRAQHHMARDPDLAAYFIDGALRALIACAAADVAPSDANNNPLMALDHHAPTLARRFRLALRAPSVAARLEHLNALIDLLYANAAPADSRES